MLKRELGLFVFNGIVSVMFAYAIYWMLVFEGELGISLSNGIAYVMGMTYGFFANKKLAFRDRGQITAKKIVRYISLHAFTLVVNVSVNLAMLESIRGIYGDMLFSFMVAISISTILNFLGLKYLVFNQIQDLSAQMQKTRSLLP